MVAAAAIAAVCCAAVPAVASEPPPTWTCADRGRLEPPDGDQLPDVGAVRRHRQRRRRSSRARRLHPARWALNSGAGLVSPVSVSCPQGTLCVAVGSIADNLFTSSTPGSHWASPASIDAATPLTGVSCPTATLCFAIDNNGKRRLERDADDRGSWIGDDDRRHRAPQRRSRARRPRFCVAVDSSGDVLASTDPDHASWPMARLASRLADRRSPATARAACVAVAADGTVYATANAITAPVTWSTTPLDATGAPLAVSCTDAGLCVIVDDRRQRPDERHRRQPAHRPGPRRRSTPAALNGVSCVVAGLLRRRRRDAATPSRASRRRRSATTGTGTAVHRRRRRR